MSVIKVDYGEIGGNTGGWLTPENIPNTGSSHHYEFECTNAIFLINNTSGGTIYRVYLENSVITYGATGSYSTTATYSGGKLILEVGNGFWGNYISGIYY